MGGWCILATMNRRDFLRARAAALALSAASRYAVALAAEKPPRVGPDRLRLVRQVRPAAPDPGRAGRGRLAVRRGQADAGRGRRDGGRPAGVEEEAAHLRRLPRDAQGEGPRHRADRHARPLARPADDRRRRGRGRRLRAEADQRRRGRGPGDAGRRAEAQAGGAGGHAAPQHAAPDRGPRPDHPRGQARPDRAGRDLLLLPHARRGNPPDTAPPDYLDYEMWTGPAPMRPYNRTGAPAGLAGVHGVRQRHRGRHVRPHVRHGPLDARPGLAEADRLDRRHPRRQGEQGQHLRHADRHLRLSAT